MACRAGHLTREIIHIQGEALQQAQAKKRKGRCTGWRERTCRAWRRIDKRTRGRLVYVHKG